MMHIAAGQLQKYQRRDSPPLFILPEKPACRNEYRKKYITQLLGGIYRTEAAL